MATEIVKIWDEATKAYIEYDITPEDTVEIPIVTGEVTTINSPIEVSTNLSTIDVSTDNTQVTVASSSSPIDVSTSVSDIQVASYTSGFDVSTSNNPIEVTVSGVGAAGQSAYQLWLSKGNSGTEQDFLDALAQGGIEVDSTLSGSSTNPVESQAISTALAGKVDNGRVLTDVPVDALFTDTTYTVQDGELSQNNLTNTLKTEYDAAHAHAGTSHFDGQFGSLSNVPTNIESLENFSGTPSFSGGTVITYGIRIHDDKVQLLTQSEGEEILDPVALEAAGWELFEASSTAVFALDTATNRITEEV